MGSIAKFRKKQVGFLAAALMASTSMSTSFAMPSNPHNISKSDGVHEDLTVGPENDHKMEIVLNNSKAAVDWTSFDIAKIDSVREKVTFKAGKDFAGNQVAPGWMVLNRVDGGAMTKIDGILEGKGGTVFLVNPHGITFGQGASVDVGSLVASTLDISQDDFLKATSSFTFKQKEGVNGARITNLASIKAEDGVVALLAHQVVSGVENIKTDGLNGAISNSTGDSLTKTGNLIKAGQVAMVAGKDITLELPYDKKINVKIDMPSDKVDFVVNGSDITASKGYVLMQASDAGEYGKHLVCQMGDVTAAASNMAVDDEGNIVLKAEQVDVGGKLVAKGDNAKISILGNSMIAAEVRAQGEGGEINIDTNHGASVVLAGQLYADKKITTKSNHSVIVLDKMTGVEDTVVSVAKNGKEDGWDITASMVEVASGKDDRGNDTKLIMNPKEAHDVYDKIAEAYKKDDPTAVGRAALENKLYQKFGYKVSNKVLSETLKNTNVNIKTAVDSHHHVDYEKHDIVVNADIEKLGGSDTSLKLSAFDKDAKKYYVDHYSGDLEGDPTIAKLGNIVLNADIKSVGDKEEGIEAEALNVELTAHNIIVNSDAGERVIETWGTKETEGATKPGSVIINGRTVSDETGSHDTLVIKSGNTTINGDVGVAENADESKELKNLKIYAKGNVLVDGSVKVDHDVVIRADSDPLDESEETGYLVGMVDEDGNSVYKEGYNVVVRDITAENTVKLAGEEDVTIAGVITANAKDEPAPNAVEIVAQNSFNNEVCPEIEKPIVTGEGSFWKIYSATPYEPKRGEEQTESNPLGNLYSNNYAGWGWGTYGNKSTSASLDGNRDNGYLTPGEGNRYIFKHIPTLTYTPESHDPKAFGDTINAGDVKYGVESNVGVYNNKYFLDANLDLRVAFENRDDVRVASTASEGYKAEANPGRYDIEMINVPEMVGGYKTVNGMGAVEVQPPVLREIPPSNPTPDPGNPPTTPVTPVVPDTPVTPKTTPVVPVVPETPVVPATPVTTVVTETPAAPVAPAETQATAVNPGEKPQMDALTTSNLDGTASITEAQKAQGASADRVLGLQTAELPFFNEKNGIVKLYGTYDVTVDPDKVQMEATAKVLPEPDQPANQYRELTMRLETAKGNVKFLLTYNGTVLDIYPTDKAAEKALVSGDSKKNEEIESKALFEAFNYMGITLDDLDGVYTHFKPLM